ncbi:GTP-binding protein [Pseudotenacibaculum sp. MALMAid0570]|uniref:GTP-binding protein n=1 Tax=Pseudotenacibaculum sp. MALMAid0570 TaxID=3143938 RepID=UPI0032DF0C12
MEKEKEVLLDDFSKMKEKLANPFLIKVVDEHVFIDVIKEESHFWSPQLHLEVIEEEGVTKLKGLFGPKPQVWTFFMFIHFIIATAFVGFAVWAYVNSTLDKDNVLPIVMLIVLPLVWVLLYVLGSVGKDIGKKQMKKMYDFMFQILKS